MQSERLKWDTNSEKIFSEEVNAFLPSGTSVDYKYGFRIIDMDGGIGHAGNVLGYKPFSAISQSKRQR